MIRRLFRPWRQLSTWWALTYLVLGLVIGTIYFAVVVTLVAVTVGTLPVLPVAIVSGWLLFVVSAGFGRLERSRLSAFLGVNIPEPHTPRPPARGGRSSSTT